MVFPETPFLGHFFLKNQEKYFPTWKKSKNFHGGRCFNAKAKKNMKVPIFDYLYRKKPYDLISRNS